MLLLRRVLVERRRRGRAVGRGLFAEGGVVVEVLLEVLQPVGVQEAVGEGEIAALFAGRVVVHAGDGTELGTGGSVGRAGIIALRYDEVVIGKQRVRADEFVCGGAGHCGELHQIHGVVGAEHLEQLLRFAAVEGERRVAAVVAVHHGTVASAAAVAGGRCRWNIRLVLG